MKRQLQTLPTFSGIAREWSAYKRRFQETTESGEYTDSENLTRLQQSLSGAAAKSVQALILDSSNVNIILERLERQFGQFKRIYRELREDVERIRSNGPNTIIEIADSLENLVSHLNAMKQPDYLRDPRLIEEIVTKLPYEQQIKWLEVTRAKGAQGIQILTLKDLLDFVKPRADIQREMGRPYGERKIRVNLHHEMHTKCYICDGKHRIVDCSQLKKMSSWERVQKIKAKNGCLICLKRHKEQCRSNDRCGVEGCQGRHHRMLYFRRSFGPSQNETKVSTNTSRKEPHEEAQTNLHHKFVSQIFYQIVPVALRNGKHTVETYAFLDPGSSLTLLDDQIADQLNLNGIPAPLKIKWTQNHSKEEKNSTKVQFQIKGLEGQKYLIKDVRTVSNLQLPVQTINYKDMCEDYPHLAKLPITSFKRAQPKILGLSHSHLLIPIKRMEAGPNKPIAIETPLGWLIFGNISEEVHEDHVLMIQEKEELNLMLRNYFSVEDIGVKLPETLPESKDEKRANEIIRNTLKYDGSRYEIGLLWKK